ncbi:carbohydrate kinase family protein [Pararhodobacter zhoushanensis]|uniref:Carbohydrate kinase n=1 Tax=Pararhodobacter zhoushanensis TaxID=2479545 RepID=A0ABT3GYW8_9RHOB|nr:carbohydrate kinase [Pararhodobacter zhoushanensis]MCW1932731.1 carbohydrate kinase [Pararhodobacter zhoushanensis]
MILCCGEALIDMLPVDGGAFAPHAGGAVFNTAIALGRLGAPTGFFSGLSADFMGDILRAKLAEARVDTSLSVTADRPCTLAFVQLVDGQARYAFYDEGTAGRLLSVADLPNVTAQALFFGGISLVVEPCGATYEALMQREAGKRVLMIDPNIRPGFVRDEAGYRARLGRMLAIADIVKLSLEDLDWLAPDGREAFVQGLLDGGTALVLLTDGSVGATAITQTRRVFEPARKVSVVDTVGAGDTFNAGVLDSLQKATALSRARLRELDETTIRDALRRGASAAAVTVSRAGANPPWPSELMD